VDMILALRGYAPLAPQQVSAKIDAAAARPPGPSLAGKQVLLPGDALRAEAQRVQRTLGLLGPAFVCADDDGSDIALALEAGVAVPESRRLRFFAPLEAARELVVAQGLLLRYLRQWFPAMRITSLGEALSANPLLRKRLREDDLYVIEPRAFHADQQRLAVHYDALRAELGCATNLDLQRMAVPTTAASAQNRLGLPSLAVARQTQWILEGLKVERIVVEDIHDRVAFEPTGLPVVHLADV
jgi:hypothetical protein